MPCCGDVISGDEFWVFVQFDVLCVGRIAKIFVQLPSRVGESFVVRDPHFLTAQTTDDDTVLFFDDYVAGVHFIVADGAFDDKIKNQIFEFL